MSSQSDSKSTHCEYNVEIKENITVVKIPETYVDEPLSEEQKEKLRQLDEEFLCRYTDKDEDYLSTVKLGCIIPPLVSTYRPYRKYRRDDSFRCVKRRKDQCESSYNMNSDYSHNHKQRYNHNYRR